MSEFTETVDRFFTAYAAALLARDEAAIARLYAVPALIVFPGQLLPVTEATQTEQFFAAAWEQYTGVEEADSEVAVLAATANSIWADVTWRYDGRVQERFCYQLVEQDGTWRIAVLTPLDTP